MFASKRGTYDRNGPGFKGDVTSSNKDIAFRLPCDPGLDHVAVFEAPIDLMSFCTLHRQMRSNAVALCGLYRGPLDNYLRENPHLKQIVLCLDRRQRRSSWTSTPRRAMPCPFKFPPRARTGTSTCFGGAARRGGGKTAKDDP